MKERKKKKTQHIKDNPNPRKKTHRDSNCPFTLTVTLTAWFSGWHCRNHRATKQNLIAKTVWWLLVMFGGSFFLLMAGIEAPYGELQASPCSPNGSDMVGDQTSHASSTSNQSCVCACDPTAA